MFYEKKVDSTKKNIVLASIGRNVGQTFDLDFARITSAFSDFNVLKWIIVESNSTDNSIEVLINHSKQHDCLQIETLKNTGSSSEFRTEKLARARNKYIDVFNEIREKSNVHYLVVCDLNNLNKEINIDSVRSCFQSESVWAAQTANQNGPYYDIWALRHKYWNDYDCWERYEVLKEIYTNSTLALWDSVYSRMINIPKTSPWIKVDSAFGGLAIYDSTYLSGCRYIGVSTTGKQVCEHLSFNESILKNGGSIFINPSFINFKLTDHSRRKKYFKYYNLKYRIARLLRVKSKN